MTERGWRSKRLMGKELEDVGGEQGITGWDDFSIFSFHKLGSEINMPLKSSIYRCGFLRRLHIGSKAGSNDLTSICFHVTVLSSLSRFTNTYASIIMLGKLLTAISQSERLTIYHCMKCRSCGPQSQIPHSSLYSFNKSQLCPLCSIVSSKFIKHQSLNSSIVSSMS
jgi:hypothetical protein